MRRAFLRAGLTVGLLFGAVTLMATLDPPRAALVAVVSGALAGGAFAVAARGG